MARKQKKQHLPLLLSIISKLRSSVAATGRKMNKRRKSFLNRRPHRSFRLTRKRDYKRSLELPGYWGFTNYVRSLLWQYKKLFLSFIVLHALMTGLVLGLMSQESFQVLNDAVKNIRENALEAEVGETTQNVAVFAGVIAGVFNAPLTEAQQIYAALIALVGWMVIVWLLRQILAGHTKVKLRDGLYSAGSPLIATFIVLLIVLIQCLPISLAMIAYVTAESAMAFDSVLFTTLFWIVELILILLSVYWLTSSLLALVIVTLPGMYPLKAMKAAGDLVVGRRLRVLYRLLWLVFILFIIWAAILIPAIIISNITAIEWLPIVPIVVLFLSSFTLLCSAAYIYLLYRKIVDDGSAPA